MTDGKKLSKKEEDSLKKANKKGARIEIQPRINPISYEKPRLRPFRKEIGCTAS